MNAWKGLKVHSDLVGCNVHICIIIQCIGTIGYTVAMCTIKNGYSCLCLGASAELAKRCFEEQLKAMDKLFSSYP